MQLDKLSPEQVGDAVRAMATLPRQPLLIVAGGVNEANAAAYAAAGAGLLVTSAAYAAPPADLSVTITAAAP